MLQVRLKNPSLILTPVSEGEKDVMDLESIYVLYRLPESDDINIGMMSPITRKYSPSLANVWHLDSATSYAFFYNGGASLEENASRFTDRPVYKVAPSDDRKVAGYSVLNATEENGLEISLEDVVDGDGPLTKRNTLTR